MKRLWVALWLSCIVFKSVIVNELELVWLWTGFGWVVGREQDGVGRKVRKRGREQSQRWSGLVNTQDQAYCGCRQWAKIGGTWEVSERMSAWWSPISVAMAVLGGQPTCGGKLQWDPRAGICGWGLNSGSMSLPKQVVGYCAGCTEVSGQLVSKNRDVGEDQ